ncbi:putative ABC-transporter type IV [Bifidobacterium sp. DSM 109957]|uniref:Putative ABC-transporter type IV n=2 Tax=Bifidobacterium oedipodis TaxID=2675322 RepID=A0A7Y0ENE4_9BIFI|nr:putative ABC-transporter type IV [Bifidobacterium sp. DSM 109957]
MRGMVIEPSGYRVDDVNGDGKVDIDDKRLPLIVRIYGALVLLDGLMSLPLIVLSALYAVREIMAGRVHVDALNLNFLLSVADTAVLTVNAALLIIFGVLLLRNRRRHAARWAYTLIPLTSLEAMLSMALLGIGANLIAPLVQVCILITLSVFVDPALLEERRLKHALRRLDERESYWDAVKKGMLGRDQSGKGYISLDFFNMFWLFVIGCVFGLAIESVYHVAIYHEWQDRAGLLFGPFSPIYGFGAVILTACLNRLWRSNWLLIFCSSAVIGGTFEYIVSWLMETTFGIKAWDYTGQWLSIDGRTSGKYMFFWGLLGLMWIKVILPWLLWLINKIPWKVRYSLTAVCFALMVANCVMTLMAVDCWFMRVGGNVPDSPVTHWFATYFDNDYMANRFQTMNLDPSRAGTL